MARKPELKVCTANACLHDRNRAKQAGVVKAENEIPGEAISPINLGRKMTGLIAHMQSS